MRNCQSGFNWINPALRCSDSLAVSKESYVQLENKLIDYIKQNKNNGTADQIAVYFRDLEYGPVFGINEDENFIPASLLKVPIMLTYYKLAESNPGILNEKLLFTGGEIGDFGQTINSDQVVDTNKVHLVSELLVNMAAYSNNNSMIVLSSHLYDMYPEKNIINETLQELGIIDPRDDMADASITVKSYSSIFRLLYNASYLSKEYSDEVLEILTHSTYVSGLRAGVPREVPIAHKFGERYLGNQTQLHDCGIVFYPDNPYLLCVMTKGKDFKSLSNVIADISKQVYDEFNSRKI